MERQIPETEGRGDGTTAVVARVLQMRRSLRLLSDVASPASGLSFPRSVAVIGAPMRLGQPRDGTELAPAALRSAGSVRVLACRLRLCAVSRVPMPPRLPCRTASQAL
jgi:hypothetical protein